LALPKSIIVFGLKNNGLSISAYPVAKDLFITMTYLAFQTSNTGIPAIDELGSSIALELTISFAPTTSTKSVEANLSLISSISWTIS